MKRIYNLSFLLVFISITALTGCASYRVSSNVDASVSTNNQIALSEIKIYETVLPEGTYLTVGPINVSIKKLTIFHQDPTREQVNLALQEKALILGADAIINVKYSSGIGFTTWGYMDAEGLGVKLKK